MRIAFFGTPQFAVPSFSRLFHSAHQIVGVVTQPDEPKGRGRRMSQSPITVQASATRLPVLQPTKMKDREFHETLRRWNLDAIAVVAFGRIFPQEILRIPRKGCINLHASLLPKYRGAAPIQWAIFNGEQRTGVTTMLMDAGMDTGPILFQRSMAIGGNERASELSDRLASEGAELLLETFEALENGTLEPQPQNDSLASSAPVLLKTDGAIDWTNGATTIANMVRGFDPWPGAYTYHGTERWRLWDVEAIADGPQSDVPGTIIHATRHAVRVATGHGTLEIHELQPASRRRMPVHSYLAGHSIEIGTRLTRTPGDSVHTTPEVMNR